MGNGITEIDKLRKEMKSYSDEELELIIETQKDLYSMEEMQLLEQEWKKREAERQARIIAHLPKEIVCPKCDGVNPFRNDNCQFCGYPLDKKKYYEEDWSESSEESDDYEIQTSYAFHYIISFLIPLVGFIVGAIFLAKDEEEEKSVGKMCIIIGIISMIIFSLILNAIWSIV